MFSYKDAKLAAYLRATGGLSNLAQNAFKESIGDDDTVDGTVKYFYSGEIGFMAALHSNLNVRIGAELLQHRPVSDAKGTSEAGDELYMLNSSVSAFIPNLTLEYTLPPTGNVRMYLLAGVGYADVTVENRFAMSTAGSAAYGVSDFNELMQGTATSYHLGTGIEFLFTDNVTCAMDIGYRMLQVANLKYKGDVNSILAPAGAAKGDPVLNADGSNRTLNLGGIQVGIGFRFYLNFL